MTPRKPPTSGWLAHPDALDPVDARTLAALLEATNPAAARREVGQLCSHPAGAGPPQNRHRPSPNRPHLPIQNQDQQDAGQAGIFR